MIIVGKYQLLLQHIDLVDILHIDDETFANTHKCFVTRAQLFCQSILHLTKIHTDGSSELVNHNNIRIVSVSLEIDNL